MQAPSYQDDAGHWWDWDGTQYVMRAEGAVDPTVPTGGSRTSSTPAPTLGPEVRPTDPVTASGGGTGGAGSTTDIFNAPLTKMFGEKFTPPGMLDLGGVPGLSYIPQAPSFDFKGPTPAEAANDPGYQFTLGQGKNQLENWAAAKGTLNDSSTAKALQDYGQAAAGQQYSNVWNRDFNAATAAFAPRLSEWNTLASAGQRQNENNYTNAWNDFLNRQSEFYNWQNSVWNKQFSLANA